MLNRGDVVLVLFPNSDLVTFNRGPALIVQADNLDTRLPQVVIALNSRAAQGSGLLTDSIVMTDSLATVLDKAIVIKLGHLAEVKPVEMALRVTPGV